MRVGPPAIRGHDRLGVGEQLLGVVLVTVGRDVQVGVTLIEDAPQRAALTRGPPARLVHIHGARCREALQQVRVRLGERVRDTARIASTVPVLIRDPNSCSQQLARRRGGRSGCAPTAPRPPPENADRTCSGRPRAAARPARRSAARATHPLRTMLRDRDRDHGQLLDLVAHRLAHSDPLVRGEDVTAATALGPMLDDLVDRPRRQQRPTLALMTRLGALPTPRRILATPGRAGGRIGARRKRGVARTTIQPPLELRDPLILPRDPRGQAPGSARSIRNSTSTTASRPRHRSPPPQPAPHHRIRRSRVMSPNQLNAYQF